MYAVGEATELLFHKERLDAAPGQVLSVLLCTQL